MIVLSLTPKRVAQGKKGVLMVQTKGMQAVVLNEYYEYIQQKHVSWPTYNTVTPGKLSTLMVPKEFLL